MVLKQLPWSVSSIGHEGAHLQPVKLATGLKLNKAIETLGSVKLLSTSARFQSCWRNQRIPVKTFPWGAWLRFSSSWTRRSFFLRWLRQLRRSELTARSSPPSASLTTGSLQVKYFEPSFHWSDFVARRAFSPPVASWKSPGRAERISGLPRLRAGGVAVDQDPSFFAPRTERSSPPVPHL